MAVLDKRFPGGRRNALSDILTLLIFAGSPTHIENDCRE
jgi:hypothetical protein